MKARDNVSRIARLWILLLLSSAACEEPTTSAAPIAVAPLPPPASISVTLTAASVTAGGTTQATAEVRDAAGNMLTGTGLSWSSSNTAIASVSGTGLVTAVAAGRASITATSGGKTGAATLTVTPVVTPSPPSLVGTIAFTTAGGGIHTMNADGTNWARLGDGFAPAWMPDGSLLYLSQACAQCPLLPWFRTSDGNAHPFLPEAVSDGWSFYGISPTVDGSRVAFVRGIKPNGYAMPDSHELVIATLGEFSLTKVPLPDAIVALDRPSWSPDESRIVFSCADTDDQNLVNIDLCFVNTDGSGFKRFGRDDQREFQPAWNPKTGVIAFTRLFDIGGDTQGGWINTIEGEDGRQLRDYGYGEGPAWSPDGSTLLFCRGSLIAVSDNAERVVFSNPRGPFLYELAWGRK